MLAVMLLIGLMIFTWGAAVVATFEESPGESAEDAESQDQDYDTAA